jgi:PST family polysaccharide transporter
MRGLRGALIGLSVSQGCVFLLTLAACRRAVWFRVRDLWGGMDPQVAANLGRFVLMAFASVVAAPTSQMLIRRDIVAAFGMHHAGYWDASVKLSNTYLALATTTLSLYLLPRLSELPTMADVRREVWRSWRLIVPATAAAALAFYVLREWVILLIFTPKFMPMIELLAWQLVGDVVKTTSWVVGYVLIARARSIEFISTEIVFSLLLWALTALGMRLFGFQGISVGYAVTYVLYLVTVYFLVMGFRRRPMPASVAA